MALGNDFACLFIEPPCVPVDLAFGQNGDLVQDLSFRFPLRSRHRLVSHYRASADAEETCEFIRTDIALDTPCLERVEPFHRPEQVAKMDIESMVKMEFISVVDMTVEHAGGL